MKELMANTSCLVQLPCPQPTWGDRDGWGVTQAWAVWLTQGWFLRAGSAVSLLRQHGSISIS